MINQIRKIVKIIETIFFQIIRWISILCFIALFFLVLIMVTLRFVPLFSMHWFEEIQAWIFAGLIFYGSVGLWIIRDHFRLDALDKYIRGKNRIVSELMNLFVELASLLFISVFTYQSYWLQDGALAVTNLLMIPEKYIFASTLLIPGVIMLIYSLKNVIVAVNQLINALFNKEGTNSSEQSKHIS